MLVHRFENGGLLGYHWLASLNWLEYRTQAGYVLIINHGEELMARNGWLKSSIGIIILLMSYSYMNLLHKICVKGALK